MTWAVEYVSFGVERIMRRRVGIAILVVVVLSVVGSAGVWWLRTNP